MRIVKLFNQSTPGGSKVVYKNSNRMFSRIFVESFSKRVQIYDIPWHNPSSIAENRMMKVCMYSFHYVFQNPRYYKLLISIALNPNPFRWIFMMHRRFAEISMSIKIHLRSINNSCIYNDIYTVCCQSELVKSRLETYTNAILYGEYGTRLESGSTEL